ncbi:TetR/AcrR family transcriptional regulator [Microbacterium horticulturae]|uniref:TetR/AcrR family transcriptional regulator n=1 Tax=Microbacterium horticulturae TaxID=3028316 RepID=A0ABY8BYR4_9MICO|nr:TetR/AcrR family transcriptional regulator [Microbacterium sp. KACC 23027]WEG09339.1 TetR/AcrR family transcriptional regulator [Microbacterium sp. KACC 23027]
MARPSVAAERRVQIAEATIRCIGAHGYAGTTLDLVAEEAGMARGHVRHFAGNRDEMLVAAAWYLYFSDFPSGDDDAAPTGGSFLPTEVHDVETALDYLFGDFGTPGLENTAALAFVEAGRMNPDIHRIVAKAYESMHDEVAAVLAAASPSVDAAECARVAAGVVSIALGNVFMNDIEVTPARNAAARATAELLISTLGG